MNPIFKKSTPTAAIAHRARAQEQMANYKSTQQAIRADRNMPDKFEHRNTVERSMAKVARVNAKRVSLGQSAPELQRPARWNK